jgi:hypothetical protein
MVRRLKNPQIFLALIISVCIPIFLGYLSYCDLAEGDFFSPSAGFENADVDDIFLLPRSQNNLNLFGSIGSNALFFSVFFPEQTGVFEQPYLFSSQSSSLDKKTLVLRC